ncbi:MAG: dihydroorotate dehydrogenase [Clostridiales bacterium]|nr:dihydroorotate dehydrogenase [Clostridiales bacterium]
MCCVCAYEKKELNGKFAEVEMIELTEEEKQSMELLDEKLAGGSGALLVCVCVN